MQLWPKRRPTIRLRRFRCFGLAYLRWAMRNPAHFEIISSGRYFDHDGAAELSRDNAELIAMTERMLAEAFAQGHCGTCDLKPVPIAGRALVYGFARMNIDGHFPRWGVAEAEAERDRRGGPRSLHRGHRQASTAGADRCRQNSCLDRRSEASASLRCS